MTEMLSSSHSNQTSSTSELELDEEKDPELLLGFGAVEVPPFAIMAIRSLLRSLLSIFWLYWL